MLLRFTQYIEPEEVAIIGEVSVRSLQRWQQLFRETGDVEGVRNVRQLSSPIGEGDLQVYILLLCLLATSSEFHPLGLLAQTPDLLLSEIPKCNSNLLTTMGVLLRFPQSGWCWQIPTIQ
jgi:hypothetical protein